MCQGGSLNFHYIQGSQDQQYQGHNSRTNVDPENVGRIFSEKQDRIKDDDCCTNTKSFCANSFQSPFSLTKAIHHRFGQSLVQPCSFEQMIVSRKVQILRKNRQESTTCFVSTASFSMDDSSGESLKDDKKLISLRVLNDLLAHKSIETSRMLNITEQATNKRFASLVWALVVLIIA